eukprot:366346-Chlamydomonas_euryale.AAC.6
MIAIWRHEDMEVPASGKASVKSVWCATRWPGCAVDPGPGLVNGALCNDCGLAAEIYGSYCVLKKQGKDSDSPLSCGSALWHGVLLTKRDNCCVFQQCFMLTGRMALTAARWNAATAAARRLDLGRPHAPA